MPPSPTGCSGLQELEIEYQVEQERSPEPDQKLLRAGRRILPPQKKGPLPQGVAHQVWEETPHQGPRGSGRSLVDRREWETETLGHSPASEAAMMDIQACAQMRIFEHSCKSLAGESQTKWQSRVVQRLA